ncbi:acetate kinase [Massilia sp. TS11]|uniref:acetate kinase n=1 Tax=Massilia sp. TS11 TaxID=2908003 RepID=UPI001EDC63D1|nr:acetate kinase [Massilia sp. TS11]MCG2585743.1 acetate kinase [Massilia sp. TS11]
MRASLPWLLAAACALPAAAEPAAPPAVAPLFEQPSVLTPAGHWTLEPSAQLAYASSNRVALVGYTIIPAILIGLIDVREVKRTTLTAALALRRGFGKRWEAELRLPYVARQDATVSRELFTGTAVERVFDTSGHHQGDAELSLRYQLSGEASARLFTVAGLRLKSRSGRDPFEVVTDCVRRCVGENATGTGLPLEVPTGSGFVGVQPSLTWLLAADPAVLFGSLSYTRNLPRHQLTRRVRDGQSEWLGTLSPGDAFGMNLGVGLALNEQLTVSAGYDHTLLGRARQNGAVLPGAVRTQLGTLLLGMSYRLDAKRSINISLGAGLTRDTPDVSLNLRLPFAL